MRIVLDTCVLVAAARSLEGASNRILRSLPIDGIEPCLSVALYAEWQEVLCRPENLQARQTLEDAQAFLRYLASICHHQDVHFLWRPFLKDPDDQRGQELIIDILYWFFLQWEKFVRDYDLKGGEEAE